VSFSCDVNVLLHASDSSSPVHQPAQRFLTQATAGGDLFCLGWPTVMSYLRIATQAGIFSAPQALLSQVRDPFAPQPNADAYEASTHIAFAK
jgi:predicted nucleic acid-binding protein